jgi:DNA-directed RNA polymerase specialized sigma24 family protein
MDYRDQTNIGGARESFLTTHWSLIEDVKRDKGKDNALIGLLLERYWKPVYCYLRRKGYDNENAKDLTQGFFHEVVLNRHLVQRADACKGRFRTFILHALSQYVVDQQRKETAQKRIPRDMLARLDFCDPAVFDKTLCELDAEQGFNYAWKAELLGRVLTEVEEAYAKRGMKVHWCVFRDRLLKPVMEDRDAPSLTEICQVHAIKDEITASNMLKTVKRQFQSTMRKHVRQTVISGEIVEEELGEIFEFLGKKRSV